MKRFKKLFARASLLATAAACALSAQCFRIVNGGGGAAPNPTASTIVKGYSAGIDVRVVDEAGNPIPGALLRVNDWNMTTDSSGMAYNIPAMDGETTLLHVYTAQYGEITARLRAYVNYDYVVHANVDKAVLEGSPLTR